jgi:hypothetical protein
MPKDYFKWTRGAPASWRNSANAECGLCAKSGTPLFCNSVTAARIGIMNGALDNNPIKQVFAKLKLLLRKTAERTVEATWQRIGTLLDAFPPSECAKYLRNSGHASIYGNKL